MGGVRIYGYLSESAALSELADALRSVSAIRDVRVVAEIPPEWPSLVGMREQPPEFLAHFDLGVMLVEAEGPSHAWVGFTSPQLRKQLVYGESSDTIGHIRYIVASLQGELRELIYDVFDGLPVSREP